MKIKTFTNKGQMISYYNKMKNNNKLASCFMGFFAGIGYAIYYSYK